MIEKTNNILLIFDCDGILVDSEALHDRVMIRCLQREGFSVDEAYAKKYFHGFSNKDCITQVESAFKRSIPDNFFNELLFLTREEINNTLQPIAGVKESLDLLPYPKCVASGSEPEMIELSLAVTGLKKYFSYIFSSLQVPRGKPFPDIFLYAAIQMNFTPDQCIVIEDSLPGMQAALAAGMKTLLYKPLPEDNANLPEGVTVFTDMHGLPSLIGKMA